MRPIDADALKEVFWNMGDDDFSYGSVCAKVDEAPTIDTDRPHGEWVEIKNLFGEKFPTCSVCGLDGVQIKTGQLAPFCPNCGAKMKASE